jgi:hypothetical protein
MREKEKERYSCAKGAQKLRCVKKGGGGYNCGSSEDVSPTQGIGVGGNTNRGCVRGCVRCV